MIDTESTTESQISSLQTTVVSSTVVGAFVVVDSSEHPASITACKLSTLQNADSAL